MNGPYPQFVLLRAYLQGILKALPNRTSEKIGNHHLPPVIPLFSGSKRTLEKESERHYSTSPFAGDLAGFSSFIVPKPGRGLQLASTHPTPVVLGVVTGHPRIGGLPAEPLQAGSDQVSPTQYSWNPGS